jgi:hypothetical protein
LCIPKPPAQQAPPLTPLVPTTVAASNLQLGGPDGVPRGAAALGRLQLRLGGSGQGATGGTDTPPNNAAPVDLTTQASAGTPQDGGRTSLSASAIKSYTDVLNPNLRFS